MTATTPDRIMDVALGFWPAKTLLSAVELGLFSTLGGEAKTGAELCRVLQLHERSNPDFFDALVALRFLERDGDGAQALYRNSQESRAFLDRRSVDYIGGFLEMANARLYPFWANLTEALRTATPQNETKGGGAGLFEELYSEPARLEQFLEGMAGISKANFRAFVEEFDFTGYQTLCDVGGATGQLCMMVAERYPHVRCTSADLPAVKPIATRKIKEANLDDRVTAQALDFFSEPLPSADVITMGMILHDWNLDDKMRLIRAAYAALPEGGALVAIENLIDDARRENAFGLLMSLNMMIEFGDGGFDFTGADFARWCAEAGFREFEVIPLRGPASAAVAYK